MGNNKEYNQNSASQQPNKDGFISVSGDVFSECDTINHQLYWREYGNPEGFPVLLLHGGPGSGSMVSQVGLFDCELYRIIMFDQRGAGRSTPHASLDENNTWHLVEDINKIRQYLAIKGKMHMFGGSWGSTLALIYAIKHPDNVTSLTLYGIFLGREKDIADFYQSNATDLENLEKSGEVQRKLYKEWRRYVEFIPKQNRGDMLESYNKYLTSDNEEARLKAAQHWNRWERAALRYVYDEKYIETEPDDFYNLAHARLENHYFRQGLFLSENNGREQNYILDNINNIADIPLSIIQGECDYVCPKNQAEDLFVAAKRTSKIYPPKLHIVRESGHSMLEPKMQEAIKNVIKKCY